jgi:hypothetical protein
MTLSPSVEEVTADAVGTARELELIVEPKVVTGKAFTGEKRNWFLDRSYS